MSRVVIDVLIIVGCSLAVWGMLYAVLGFFFN